jgi:hypothetical protein
LSSTARATAQVRTSVTTESTAARRNVTDMMGTPLFQCLLLVREADVGPFAPCRRFILHPYFHVGGIRGAFNRTVTLPLFLFRPRKAPPAGAVWEGEHDQSSPFGGR